MNQWALSWQPTRMIYLLNMQQDRYPIRSGKTPCRSWNTQACQENVQSQSELGCARDSRRIAPVGIRGFRKNRIQSHALSSAEFKAVSDVADVPKQSANKCSIYFFIVPTVAFKILFVLVILHHCRRKVVHFNVTSNPTVQWTTQQVVEAFPLGYGAKVFDAGSGFNLWRPFSQSSEKHGH